MVLGTLHKYRRGVIALTAVVLLTTAIEGAHANDALYLVFWLRRCNFSFISFPSVLLPAVYGFSIPAAFVYCVLAGTLVLTDDDIV